MESKQVLNPCQMARKSAERILGKGKAQVAIDEGKIAQFVKDLKEKVVKEGLAYEKWSKYHIVPNDFTLEQVLAYTFVVDGLNFCFWPDHQSGEFEYEHMTQNLAKLLRDTPEFFSPDSLASLQEDSLRTKVFNPKFCLMGERTRILNEMGAVIRDQFEGSFTKFLRATDFHIPRLVQQIISFFPGFRDEAIYEGEQVFFYKRAQILAADLVGALSEFTKEQIELKGQEQLTMFADYRVPQILRHLGMFVYSKSLAEKVDSEVQLDYSSKEEVEIRAATIVAVQKIILQISQDPDLSKLIRYEYEVDWLLWQMGEACLGEMKPHHRVLSIFY